MKGLSSFSSNQHKNTNIKFCQQGGKITPILPIVFSVEWAGKLN